MRPLEDVIADVIRERVLGSAARAEMRTPGRMVPCCLCEGEGFSPLLPGRLCPVCRGEKVTWKEAWEAPTRD